MMAYLDTGVLLKLYTIEPESDAVRACVVGRRQAIPFLAIHQSECASALHLKVFRGECTVTQANRALEDIQADVRTTVLRVLVPDWTKTWQVCGELGRAHASIVGCRTLDTLHVACALELGFREFMSFDGRQSQLAERVGLSVICPI